MSTTNVALTLNGTTLAAAVPEALVVSVRRGLVGKRRHSRVEIPGRAGAWTFAEEPGDRTIEIDLDLLGIDFEARREAVRELAYWCDIGAPAKLVIEDEPDRFHLVLLDDAPDVNEWLLRGAVALRFTADPYAYLTAATVRNFTATTNPDNESFSIPDRVSADPVVVLGAVGGNVTAFTLTVNGYVLSWAGSISAGTSLTISSISDTVSVGPSGDVELTGAFNVNDLDMADVSGQFPILLEGSNAWALSWTGSATSVSISFTWRERTR